jgi:hypothetical protein
MMNATLSSSPWLLIYAAAHYRRVVVIATSRLLFLQILRGQVILLLGVQDH